MDSEILKYLEDVEEAAEEILTDRQTMVDYDRKRNGNRTALRELKKSTAEKSWCVMGNTFFKLKSKHVTSILENDQKRLDEEIKRIGDNLKEKVNKLRILEKRPELKGFDLKPLSNVEVKAVTSFVSSSVASYNQ